MLSRSLLTIALTLLSFTNALAKDADNAKPWWTPAVEQALQRAGDRRAEWVDALNRVPKTQREGFAFLLQNMPDRDLKTLTADFVLENVALAYKAINDAPWGKQIPKALFLNDILPYVNVNEARDPWRKSFHEKFWPLVKDCKTPSEAAQKLNSQVFKQLNVRYSRQRRRAGRGRRWLPPRGPPTAPRSARRWPPDAPPR